MTLILRFLQLFALGSWVGSIVYFSSVVTVGAFRVLADRDQAGALVGFALGGLHLFGLIAAIIYLLAALGRERSLRALLAPAALGVILMFVLTLASGRIVIARMETLRTQMISVDGTAGDNRLRAEFDRLHQVSVRLEGAVLLIGLAAFFLTVRSETR
jgi:Domain of unknown function (DUF4149)